MVTAIAALPVAALGASRGIVPLPVNTIIDEPVAFEVVNTDTSKAPCGLPNGPDNNAYEMHGRFVGPANAKAITVYTPGATGGQWEWSVNVPGLDNPRIMAEQGHASLVIDRLGHGTSGRPKGLQMCVGSEADVLHQIVGKLRSGEYRFLSGRGPVPRFERVATAGISLGSAISQIEAYSYHDTDALVILGWADQITRACSFLPDIAPQAPSCLTSTDGYYWEWATPQDEAGDVFYDPERRVVGEVIASVEREACGSNATVLQPLFAWDQAFVPTINVPVLIANGEYDKLFTPESTVLQPHRYLSSPDAEAVVIPDAGHCWELERPETAKVFQSLVGAWLDRRGF
jgi:pimeloyl-ACP methyl ester carboxylesterase